MNAGSRANRHHAGASLSRRRARWLVSETADIPISRVDWKGAVRIIRSAFPPIDLFEDIADPADWPLLISAEQKTNPRIMATLGNLDLVPVDRPVGGTGSHYSLAHFHHPSTLRPHPFTPHSQHR